MSSPAAAGKARASRRRAGFVLPADLAELQLRHRRGERIFGPVSFPGAELPGLDVPRVRLAGACLSGARLREANFSGGHLRGIDLRQADLDSGDLRRTDLREARLEQAELDGAVLAGADLRGAHLERSRLRWADLCGALIEGVILDDADLEGANLARVVGEPASAVNCRVHPTTYRESRWTPAALATWADRGAMLGDLQDFPDEALSVLLRHQQGLTLYFSKRISGFDRFLVEGVIIGTLGRNTRCHIAEFRETLSSSIVRIVGPDRESLVRVADVLSERTWELEQAAVDRALKRFGSIFGLDQVAPLLSKLAARIDRMELRLPSRGVMEMNEDQAEAFLHAKDLKLVQTWTQKAALAAGKIIGAKLLGQVEDGTFDTVKNALRPR